MTEADPAGDRLGSITVDHGRSRRRCCGCPVPPKLSHGDRCYCRSRRWVTQITPEEVKQFLLTKYADSIHGIGLIPAEIGDDFDFLLSGVIDSFGVLEMVSSIEDQFRIRLDMATLDAEQITILGPLSGYVAQHARPAERG